VTSLQCAVPQIAKPASEKRRWIVTDPTDDTNICSLCHNEVKEKDEFCPHCGSIFEKGLHCTNHAEREAEGVCIICCVPYCSRCGGRVNNLFLCSNHQGYEIYEGMARVFGVSDEVMAQYVQSCLRQSGLHPFLFSRKASPISGGGSDYTLFCASGEYDGHIINEVKLMVPCQEVLKAERLLQDLELKM
jgi:hypothetical protein